eukprot:11101977-Ditylum_brightwellii.AAC.2
MPKDNQPPLYAIYLVDDTIISISSTATDTISWSLLPPPSVSVQDQALPEWIDHDYKVTFELSGKHSVGLVPREIVAFWPFSPVELT